MKSILKNKLSLKACDYARRVGRFNKTYNEMIANGSAKYKNKLIKAGLYPKLKTN